MNTFIVITLPKLENLNPLSWDFSNLNPANWTMLKDISESLKSIATLVDYLLHPTKILVSFWNFTWEISFLICLCIALISLIFYICGKKKAAKYIPYSIIVYTIIQAIGRL